MSKIVETDPNEKVLLIQAATAQAEDIVDVQDSLGNSYFKIDKDGNLSASTVVGIQFVMDGAGATISAGTKGYVEVPFSGTVTGWTVVSDLSGDIVIDVKRSSYANFPTTVSIAGSEKPTIASARKGQDLTLTTWTANVALGDIIEFYVDSATNITKATLAIRITRSV